MKSIVLAVFCCVSYTLNDYNSSQTEAPAEVALYALACADQVTATGEFHNVALFFGAKARARRQTVYSKWHSNRSARQGRRASFWGGRAAYNQGYGCVGASASYGSVGQVQSYGSYGKAAPAAPPAADCPTCPSGEIQGTGGAIEIQVRREPNFYIRRA